MHTDGLDGNRGRNLHTQIESDFNQLQLDLVERSLTEIPHSEKIGFFPGDQLAYGSNRLAIEAIVGPDTQGQGADRHLQLLAKLIEIGRLNRLLCHNLFFRLHHGTNIRILDERVEMLAKNLRRLHKSHLRLQGTVGPDLKDQAVVIGQLTNPGILRFITNPADGRERGIHPDNPDLIITVTIFRSGSIAAALTCLEVDIKRDILGQLGNVKVRIHNGYLGPMLNVARSYISSLVDADRQFHIISVALNQHEHVLEIEHNLGNVFVNTSHAGEFVLDSFDLGVNERSSFKRGKKYSSEAVANGNPEPSFKRLYVKFTVSGLPRFIFAND